MTPLDTLKALRATYPTPMSPDQLGALLNAVAWTHRADGWGLYRKPDGAHGRQPQTEIPISSDILVNPSKKIYADVLMDADGKAEPRWGVKDDPNADPTRFVPPVDAGVVIPPDVPDVPVITVPYPGDAAGCTIGEALFSDYEKAGQAPNARMGAWFLRVAWDCASPPHMSVQAAIKKHQREWRATLGI